MKSIDKPLALLAMASIVVAVCIAAAAPQHKNQATFAERFDAVYDQPRGVKGDLEEAGLIAYHSHH